MFKVSLLVDGFEAGSGRSVRAAKNIYVSSQPYVIGYKTASNLSYLKKETKAYIDLIAVNTDLKKIKADNLQLLLYKKEFINTLVKKKVNTYIKLLKKKLKSKKLIIISSKGYNHNINTENSGSYELVIVDKDNNELNVINYTIAGEANLAGNIDKKAKLQLKLNKTTYWPW